MTQFHSTHQLRQNEVKTHLKGRTECLSIGLGPIRVRRVFSHQHSYSGLKFIDVEIQYGGCGWLVITFALYAFVLIGFDS